MIFYLLYYITVLLYPQLSLVPYHLIIKQVKKLNYMYNVANYSTFWVGCPDCDLKSVLDHVARDVVRHLTRIKRARSSVYSVNHEPV